MTGEMCILFGSAVGATVRGGTGSGVNQSCLQGCDSLIFASNDLALNLRSTALEGLLAPRRQAR